MYRSPPLLPAREKIAIWCVKFICNQILEVSGSVYCYRANFLVPIFVPLTVEAFSTY